MTVNKWK